MADEETTAPQQGKEWSSDPKVAKVERKIVGLKQTNMKMMQDIISVGGNPELGVPRIEHFITWLRESGAFTYEEQLEEEEKWQLSMRRQLKPIVDQIRAAARLAGAQEKTQSGIVISRGGVGGKA